MKDTDPFHLSRFVTAQDPTFARASAELAAGAKQSHWMWFIFPQIAGLGSSAMAQRFALSGLKEASAYLEHPLLGARLRHCTVLVNDVRDRSAREIFGYPDDLKFCSSMTLFGEVAVRLSPQDDVFTFALGKYFGGQKDQVTLRRLTGDS